MSATKHDFPPERPIRLFMRSPEPIEVPGDRNAGGAADEFPLAPRALPGGVARAEGPERIAAGMVERAR